MQSSGVILASGLVLGLLNNDIRLAFPSGRTNRSAIDASRPLVEPPAPKLDGPVKATMPPPVSALAICRGGNLGIDILAVGPPMSDVTPDRLSLSRPGTRDCQSKGICTIPNLREEMGGQ